MLSTTTFKALFFLCMTLISTGPTTTSALSLMALCYTCPDVTPSGQEFQNEDFQDGYITCTYDGGDECVYSQVCFAFLMISPRTLS